MEKSPSHEGKGIYHYINKTTIILTFLNNRLPDSDRFGNTIDKSYCFLRYTIFS